MSEITNKDEPIRVEESIKSFGESSFNSLEIWGAIRPIKPIIPTTETVVDASKEHIIKNNTLSKFTFTPYITALRSPCCIKPRSFENNIDMRSEHVKIIASPNESFNVAFVREPVVQKVIW